LRRRILLTLLASTSIVLIAFLVPLWVIIGDLAVDRTQRHVVLETQPVVSRIPIARRADLAALVMAYSEQSGRPVTLYLADDTVIGQPRPLGPGVRLARDKGAFFAEAEGGRDLLIPVYAQGGDAVLRVFVPASELTGAVPGARLALLALGALLLALSVGAGLVLARSFLRPISELSATAEKLSAGDLSARVQPNSIPEIHSAGRELNRLAGRVVELLSLEREEVADLAHRLRTPVAALRLDAETLPEMDSARRLRADVDALERMVDEVIREARRPLREDLPVCADLCEVARDRAQFWSVLAEDQDRHLTVDLPPGPLHVATEPRDLGDALDALIGNVFAHTPEGVDFRVSAGVSPGPIPWVEISDHGPGLPQADVLERGTSATGSTGLGLDIARRLAERTGGSMEVGSASEGGARVRMRLTPAAAE
jgi:signal transduction histidine kinase